MHIGPGEVWRCGGVVLKHAPDATEATWVAHTLDTLRVDGLRIARPLRSSDGRWVVSGWSATRYIAGRPEPRHDEVVAASLRLHAATASLPRPEFLDERSDLWSIADAVAWGERDPDTVVEVSGDAVAQNDRDAVALLVAARVDTAPRPQIVHGDLFGNVLFAGSAQPGVIDFTPYWRPPEWAAAVVAVDALAWGGADAGLVQRWKTLTDWPQMLLRALLFRVVAHAMHPRSTPQSRAGLDRALAVVAELV